MDTIMLSSANGVACSVMDKRMAMAYLGSSAA